MPESLAYLNGQFLPFSAAMLPLNDAGFVWGATVVDNCRTYAGKLFRWPDHLSRFRRDCMVCQVPLERSDEKLTAAAERLIATNRTDSELQLVTFATPGPLGFYTGEECDGPPTVGMVTYPIPKKRYRRFFSEGVTLAAAVNPFHQPTHFNDTFLTPTAKHRSRMAWWVAERAMGVVGYPPHAVPLFFDRPDGTPTETAFANVLVVVDGTVVTPPRHLVLDGISLRFTQELCSDLRIPFAEAGLDDFHPPNVTEVMLVGTGFGIAGVREYFSDPKAEAVKFDWPGPIFLRLLTAWSQLVGIDVQAEFLDSAS